MYLLEPIKFSIHNRSYNLQFNWWNKLQIVGNAASGKSLFCRDYKEYLTLLGKDKEVLFINYENPQDANIILDNNRLSKYKTVIIDNADIVVNTEIDKTIAEDTEIYWVLIGRNMYMSVPFACMGSLSKNENSEIIIDYSKKW